MGLVEDEGVIAQQPPVALNLGEQDAVGHQLDQRAIADLIGEPHGVTDGLAQRSTQFVGDALADRAGSQPAWLGMPDCAANASADIEADLRQLGRLTRPRLTGHHDNLVRSYGGGDLITLFTDRKVWVRDRREGRQPGGDERFGRGHLFGEPLDLLGIRVAEVLQPSAQPCRVCEGQTIQPLTQVGDGWFGHSENDRRYPPAAHSLAFSRGPP